MGASPDRLEQSGIGDAQVRIPQFHEGRCQCPTVAGQGQSEGVRLPLGGATGREPDRGQDQSEPDGDDREEWQDRGIIHPADPEPPGSIADVPIRDQVGREQPDADQGRGDQEPSEEVVQAIMADLVGDDGPDLGRGEPFE